MRWTGAVLLLCLALAGCGGEDEAPQAPERADPIREAARATIGTGGGRVDGTMTVEIEDIEAEMDVEGAVSFTDDRSLLRADYAEDGVEGATPRAMRLLRRRTSFPRDQLLDANVAFILNERVRRLDERDRWLFVDLDEVRKAGDVDLRRLAGMPEVNPAAMVEMIAATGTSSPEGDREQVGGELMQRHRVSVDPAAFPSAVPAEDRESAERTVALVERWWGEAARDVTVWTNHDGLIRRLRFSFALPMVHEIHSATAEFDLDGLGDTPVIDIPEVEDTTDATPLAIEHAQ